MNELYREQHPLLCDDFSDDDLSTRNCSPRSNKRLKAIVYGGHTKNQMKGAAAIFKTWPEHWWSSFKYWWMGLGMTAIVILIVYNSVVAFSILPMVYTKSLNTEDAYSYTENLKEELSTSNVFMHAFADTKSEINLNDFLPYVEIISKRYPNFRFHFIVVINETFKDSEEINDETNNVLALNALWTDTSLSKKHRIVDNNLVVSYVSINNYLTNPVLQKISTNFSKEFMEFLVRILSIWEKGGIVFNPTILTPRSPNGSYIEKIYNILNNYVEQGQRKAIKIKENTGQSIKVLKPKKKFDNIRDIINAMEEDEKLYNVSQHNLIEMEDKVYSVTVDAGNDVKLLRKGNGSDSTSTHQTYFDKDRPSNASLIKKSKTYDFVKDHDNAVDGDVIQPIVTANSTRNSTQPSLLPLFLKYLFPKKGEIDSFNTKERTLRSHNIHYETGNNPSTDSKKQDSFPSFNTDNGLLDAEENSHLTIDLKGNIVASNTPCHAFVGNLLSNAAHHSDEETLTEFIISELTVFCKGVLSSCKGIDVIL